MEHKTNLQEAREGLYERQDMGYFNLYHDIDLKKAEITPDKNDVQITSWIFLHLLEKFRTIKIPNMSIRTLIIYYVIHPLMLLLNTEIRHSGVISKVLWENNQERSIKEYVKGSFKFDQYDERPFHNRLFQFRMGTFAGIEMVITASILLKITNLISNNMLKFLPENGRHMLLLPITHIFYITSFIGLLIIMSQILLIAAPVTTFIIAPLIRLYAHIIITVLCHMVNYKGYTQNRNLDICQELYERQYLRSDQDGTYLVSNAPKFNEFVLELGYLSQKHPVDFTAGMNERQYFPNGYNMWDVTTMNTDMKRRFLRYGYSWGPRKDEKLREYTRYHITHNGPTYNYFA